jgi:replicative DNA helicase
MEGRTMPDGNWVILGDYFDEWQSELLSGRPPDRFAIAPPDSRLSTLDFGPGRVWVVGGQPGAGKTAFCLQLTVDALRLNTDLRAVICNVEMPPGQLLNRQLARLSGIPLRVIMGREFGRHHHQHLEAGLDALQTLGSQLVFCRPPFTVENIAAAADAVGAQVILADYIQRIPLRQDSTIASDKRGSIDATMAAIRQMADMGVAVIVVAALSRQKSAQGSTYHGAGLASFRESSELEYGADDAFILETSESPGEVILKHVKSRYGAHEDIVLAFNGSLQRFHAPNLPPANRDEWQDAINGAFGESE